jgi:hypothetical protein
MRTRRVPVRATRVRLLRHDAPVALEPSACPFCRRLAGAELLAKNDQAAAFLDSSTVGPGHAPLLPRRHVADLFDLTSGDTP